MKWLFAAFLLAMAGTGFGLALIDGRIRGNETAVRTIHYDTKYDLSSQRRAPTE